MTAIAGLLPPPPPPQNWVIGHVTYEGCHMDNGAAHRAAAIARDLRNAGRAARNTSLIVVDPYTMHTKLAMGRVELGDLSITRTEANNVWRVALPVVDDEYPEFDRAIRRLRAVTRAHMSHTLPSGPVVHLDVPRASVAGLLPARATLPTRWAHQRYLEEINTSIQRGEPQTAIPSTKIPIVLGEPPLEDEFNGLPEAARREALSAMRVFMRQYGDYLRGDGTNHTALYQAQDTLNREIRRIGRTHCGHGTRTFTAAKRNPFEKASPVDKAADQNARLAELRALVATLLGVTLPDDLEAQGGVYTYQRWRYTMLGAPGSRRLRMERLIPVRGANGSVRDVPKRFNCDYGARDTAQARQDREYWETQAKRAEVDAGRAPKQHGQPPSKHGRNSIFHRQG